MNPREFAVQVVQQLQTAGFQALWAGGCVRDQLLKIEPLDYDVATNATPDQIRQVFGKQRTLPIGAAFGVITVLGPKSAGQIEVATFRTDASYSDGRHPDSVEFSNAEEDAQRRDFTINGLFFDPVAEQVIDYVDGQQDLKLGVIRAIGDPDQRIAEDKLRMLRAVRFATRFGFEIESATFESVRQSAAGIHLVSAERIGAELRKMLALPGRALALELLVSSGLLKLVIDQSLVAELSSRSIDEVATLQLPVISNLPADSDHCAAMAVLLDGLVGHLESKADRNQRKLLQEICRRLKWSNEEIDKTTWLVNHYHILLDADVRPWSQVQPVLAHSFGQVAIDLANAKLLADRATETVDTSAASFPSINYCLERIAWPSEKLNPPLLVTGSDLIKAGFQPGPQFKSVLQEILDRQLDGELESTEDALEFARKTTQ